MNQEVAKVQAKLNNAETVAGHIQGQLETGVVQWNNARSDMEAEREKLEQVRKEMAKQMSWRDWLRYACIVAGLIGLGIGIGMHMVH